MTVRWVIFRKVGPATYEDLATFDNLQDALDRARALSKLAVERHVQGLDDVHAIGPIGVMAREIVL